MVEDSPRAAAAEGGPREDLASVAVAAALVAFLPPGSQVAADEAEARVVEEEAHGDRALRWSSISER